MTTSKTDKVLTSRCPECFKEIPVTAMSIRKHILTHWGVDIVSRVTHPNKEVERRIDILVGALPSEEATKVEEGVI